MAKSVYIKLIFKSLVFRAFGVQNYRQGNVNPDDRGGEAAPWGQCQLGGVPGELSGCLSAGACPHRAGEGRKQAIGGLEDQGTTVTHQRQEVAKVTA